VEVCLCLSGVVSVMVTRDGLKEATEKESQRND